MPIDREKLLAWNFPDVEQNFTERDTMLYALACGAGSDPLDESELKFVYEAELTALPTMAVVLGYPGFWARDPATGIDWKRLLHGEQGLVLHKRLPSSGRIIGRTRIVDLIDKGEGKGALLYSEREIIDVTSSQRLATTYSTSFLRGDGGFGGPNRTPPPPAPTPKRACDAHLDLAILPQAALIYRLCGDYNPLHASPSIAKAAGFARPILHGLCTYAVAGRAIVKVICDNDPKRLKSLNVRFTSPVYPGETLRTQMWRESGAIAFRSSVVERGVVVLDNGRAETFEP